MPMEEKYASEDFLARWLAGELSKEELEGFEASDVYRDILAIDTAAKSLSGPKVDVERALSLVTARNQNIRNTTPKVKRLWSFTAVAACIAILFAGYTYFFGYKNYSTGIGEKETVLLADGSLVELSANSSVSFKRFGWEEDRSVNFDGEAFFDVVPGKNFTVNTSKGIISVLGTQFNIRDRKGFALQCYEGSIIFLPFNEKLTSVEMAQGVEIRLLNGEIQKQQFSQNLPDWKNGFSSFSRQPLSVVLEELALQYPVKFQTTGIDLNRKFTGNFSHNSLNDALKTTLEPMGINYDISEDKRIITLSE